MVMGIGLAQFGMLELKKKEEMNGATLKIE